MISTTLLEFRQDCRAGRYRQRAGEQEAIEMWLHGGRVSADLDVWTHEEYGMARVIVAAYLCRQGNPEYESKEEHARLIRGVMDLFYEAGRIRRAAWQKAINKRTNAPQPPPAFQILRPPIQPRAMS